MDEAQYLMRVQWEWEHGSRDLSRELAREYVAINRDRLEPLFAQRSLEELVAMVDQYRAAGQVVDMTVIQCWIMAEHGPREITGKIEIGASAVIQAAEAILRGEA